MSPAYVGAWSFAFALTCLLEIPIVVALFRGTKLPVPTLVAIALIGQLVTHPLVWFVFPFLGINATLALVLSELWAFGGEVWVYRVTLRSASLKRCAGVSLLANAVSALVYPVVVKLLS